MNRKTKIIVSITGITLVGLMLLGLTYGYFITKINGNTNAKSISVSSAKKVVEYTDLSEEISGKIIEPGYETIKVFTAKNIGNTSATYHIYLDNVVNEFIRTQDITYTLYRKVGNNTIDTSNLSDSDIVASGILPKVSNYILLNQTIETPNDYYTYALKINYINSEENQDEDQGHTFSFKVQLHAEIDGDPFKSGTLASAIYISARMNTNGTELVDTPKTKVAEEISSHMYYSDRVNESTAESSMSVPVTLQGYYWTYGTGYTIDENTGKFTLTGVSTCKYDDGTCNSTLVGKYLGAPYAANNSSSTDTKRSTTNLSNIYKVTVAPANSSSSITVKHKKISTVSYSTEETLSISEDNYGTSYYYRGGVEDNYVDFAGMCWRIVRIQGDGSIKLILEDQDNTCANSDGNWNIPTTANGSTKTGNFGYTYYASNTLTATDGTKNSGEIYVMNYLNGGIMAQAFENFQKGSLANYLDKLKPGDWCMNDKAYATTTDNTTPLTSQEILDKQIKGTAFYYDSKVRLNGKSVKEPMLKCNGTVMTKFNDNESMYVGTLTADEIVFAGGKVYVNNSDYYLLNDYQKTNNLYFWSLSPYYFTSILDYVFNVDYYGRINYHSVNNNHSFRPAVTLLSSVQITGGNGTKANAYTIG